MSMFIILFLLCLFYTGKNCENILVVATFPSISHQLVYQPIWKELSLRGHQVTVITPNPLNNSSLVNLTEINVGFTYDILKKIDLQKTVTTNLPITTEATLWCEINSVLAEAELASSVVQKLIKDDTKQFDLLLVEYLYPTMLALGAWYNCPIIGMSSFDVYIPGHDAVGNPFHPILYPDYLQMSVKENTLINRMYKTYYTIWYKLYYHYAILPKEDKIVKKYISQNLPYLGDIEKNISMLFLNKNPIIHGIRANVPAVVELGNMHLTKRHPLPKDLQYEMDRATQGIIYFSLGSNVKSTNLSSRVQRNIIDTLSQLPYLVLWKFETNDLSRKPHNVIIKNWFPQQDVLDHPNIKAFVTQGGLQSMEEAISSQVPLIGMPFFGDQLSNVLKMVEFEAAVYLDPNKFTPNELESAILEVTKNIKYRNNMKKLAEISSDIPATGLERAVWWTEYVIRHKGASHLRSPLIEMPFYEYLLLDVIFAVLLVLLLATILIYSLFNRIISNCKGFKKHKLKIE